MQSNRIWWSAPTLALCLWAGALTAVHAQSAPQADDTLYRAFGGKAGLVRLMDDFGVRLLADARMSPHFEKANMKHVKEQLVEQVCQLTGGPCVYRGADMKSAHGNLDITRADFNALVEVFQESMSAQGIAFSAQNRLLALLAPMHRDIITVR